MSESQEIVPVDQAVLSSRAALLSSLRESDTHNVVAFLDLSSSRHARSFSGIISYLQRSRIHKAISTVCTPYLSHQKEFWQNAVLDNKASPWVIKSKIFGRIITVSADTLREVLQLGDVAGDPKHINRYKVRGLFARCKYQGTLKEGIIMKSGLCPQFKYLAHVLQLCISPRRAGHDELGENIEYMFAALILNHPFDISSSIFDCIVDNLTTKQQPFLMYPRFLQMVINTQAPNIPKFEHDVLNLKNMKDSTLGRMLVFKGKDKDQRPVEKNLFGHLANPAYICPEKKMWRHDNSESDDEGFLPPDEEDVVETEGDKEGDASGPQEETETPSVSTADVESVSGGLRDEEAEKEKEKRKRKKRVVEEGVSGRSWTDFAAVPKKRKIKLNFVMKPATDPSHAQNVQQSEEPVQRPIASSTIPATTTGGSSSSPSAPASEEMSMLKNLLLKVMSDQQALVQKVDDQEKMIKDQGELIKDQGEQIRMRDVRIEELENEIRAHKNLFIEASSDTQQLAARFEKHDTRIGTLESFNANLEIDQGRILRIKAAGEGSSAAAAGCDSDYDEDEDSESSSSQSRGG